jgi:hypothetical protein
MAEVQSWTEGGLGSEPALRRFFADYPALADGLADRELSSVVVGRSGDGEPFSLLIAPVTSESIDELVTNPVPVVTPSDDAAALGWRQVLYGEQAQHRLALLPGELLVAGPGPAVQAVVSGASGRSPIDPFLADLAVNEPLSFVTLLGSPTADRNGFPADTLARASAVSGRFAVGDVLDGSITIHTPDATSFADAFNALNRAATTGPDPIEQPLTATAPTDSELGQVTATLPPIPLLVDRGEGTDEPSPADQVRNLFKKLSVGMEARAYAEGVGEGGNPPWLSLQVKSERDGGEPPSPGSVFLRWEFRDDAAIEAFEQEVLPAGFRLAPTRFFESDDPDGEYFVALNLYNSGGGSIVSGARAEWDVFVHPPAGADPDAGERPRFMVFDALAQDVSADPGNLLTPAEPLSHALVDGSVWTSVQRFDDEGQVEPVFSSIIPVPDPATAEVARFTREMAIGNDYIYWEHGVYDRVVYNATTFNHDAYFVDPSLILFTDQSPWTRFLEPELKDAVYYVNTLEYVASPMANLDSDQLDITPEWLSTLRQFKYNGHQQGLMRTAAEGLFRGADDPFVGRRLGNSPPATYYHFPITDPTALEGQLPLPPDHRLTPIALFDGGPAEHYLTLAVHRADGAPEGTRAEWIVYIGDGDGRPPQRWVVELMTEHTAIDPTVLISPGGGVVHELDGERLHTRVTSSGFAFDAESSVDAGAADERDLSLDWIESGDTICRPTGARSTGEATVCDAFAYDAETLDVPVQVVDEVAVADLQTPWGAVIDGDRPIVFVRSNPQEFAVQPWFTLDLPVEAAPVAGVDNPTHVITGSGSLVGRETDLVNSLYTYTGEAVVDGDQLRFSLDQQIDNALGTATIFTTGNFDLSTGSGTQTVVDCVGPALLCSDVVNGSTSFYAADALDASDRDAITWRADLTLDLGGGFGTADSASGLTATAVG